MSLKWECNSNGEYHSNWDITQTGMSIWLEYHSNWNVTQIWMSPKMNVIQNRMLRNIKCHSNWNLTQVGMSLKLECHFN